VVRRVQVIIEVPVKEEAEEEFCELDTERSPVAAILHHASTSTGSGDRETAQLQCQLAS
jgi:hypothetical protein